MQQTNGGPGQYDFILNGSKKPRGLGLSGRNTKQRLLIVFGGLAVLLLLIGLGWILLAGGSSSANDQMLAVAQSQTELARVSGGGVQQTKDLQVKAFAETITLTMTSSQKKTVEYLKKNGKRVGTKQLNATKSSTTDANLKSAQQAGNFDTVFNQTLQKMLADYRTQLSTQYKTASGAKQKELLNTYYLEVNALIKNQPATN